VTELLWHRARAVAALFCISLPLAACSTPDVDAGWDARAHFDELHTWAWAPTRARADARASRDSVARHIETSIARGLAARGLREVPPEQGPDLYVAYHVALDEALDTGTMYRDFLVGPYFGRWDAPENYIAQYARGTLLLDVIDTGKDELIWRGRAQTHLEEIDDPRERAARSEDIVRRVLERLPRI